jgi:uncharacterized protein
VLDRLHLIPRDERCLELLARGAQNTLDGARALLDLLEHCDDHARQARRLKDIEHTGDDLTRDVFRALHRTYVTPLDREDIGALASALDDVLDWVEEAARRIDLYRLDACTPRARRFGRVIFEQAEQIAAAVPQLRQPGGVGRLEPAIVAIHRLENEGDALLADGLTELYDGVAAVPELIRARRWQDIYEVLEEATDKAKHVAAILGDIAVKAA